MAENSRAEETRSYVIGIDHGFHMVKGTHTIFSNGVDRLDHLPTLTNDTLIYEGKAYKIGESRMDVKDRKTEDDDYYLLTMAGVARELNVRMLNGNGTHIRLAVGIPFTTFGEEREEFIKYFMRNEGRMEFNFEGTFYSIIIDKVLCFPQCYAAVADRLGSMKGEWLIVDVGSWTIDIMTVVNGVPHESRCQTFNKSIINVMQNINKKCIALTGGSIPENTVMECIQGINTTVPDKYRSIIESELKSFAQKIEGILKENGHDTDFSHIIYVGGGAKIMRTYGKHGLNISYLDDVKANAMGYEYLARKVG